MFINQHESNPQLCDKRASSKFFRAPFERRSVRDCDDEQVPVEHFLHGHQLADRFPQPCTLRQCAGLLFELSHRLYRVLSRCTTEDRSSRKRHSSPQCLPFRVDAIHSSEETQQSETPSCRQLGPAPHLLTPRRGLDFVGRSEDATPSPKQPRLQAHDPIGLETDRVSHPWSRGEGYTILGTIAESRIRGLLVSKTRSDEQR